MAPKHRFVQAYALGILLSCTLQISEARVIRWEDALHAIALTESGHDHEPWPWTLNVAGTGYYFVDRESAWQAARLLETHHVDNFDIGLMQINWHYHKRRFRSTWQALDPAVNYRVAETILNEHLQETKSLSLAIAHYHSKNPREGQPYLRKVLSILDTLK
jgi:hypothetical protein